MEVLSCISCPVSGVLMLASHVRITLEAVRALILTCSSLQVTAIEPISNDGGASVSTRHLHQSLRWLFGVAAVATDVGHVLLVDLCLDDLSCSQNEVEASGKLQFLNLNLEVR